MTSSVSSPAGHEAGFGFNADTATLTVVRAAPVLEPKPEPPVEVEYIVELPRLADAAARRHDGLRWVPAAPVDEEAPKRSGILIQTQAYNDNQVKVLSLWNSCAPGGLLDSTLQELSTGGYFDSRDDGPEAEQATALGAALLAAVAAFDSARMSFGIDLEDVPMLFSALLNREPIPPAIALEHIREQRQQIVAG